MSKTTVDLDIPHDPAKRIRKTGKWLDIGGASYAGFGTAPLEVRVATGATSWEWRRLTEDEKATLLNLWNSRDHQ